MALYRCFADRLPAAFTSELQIFARTAFVLAISKNTLPA